MKNIQWTWIPKFTHSNISGVTFGGFYASRFITSQPNAFNDSGGDKPDVADSTAPGNIPAFSVQGKPAWRYISYWNARIAAANANTIDGPGVHLLTAFEWASIAMLSHKYGCLPHGNNKNVNPPADVTYTTEIAVLDEAANARTSTYYASLTGTGPATWNLLHDPNGPADLNGNTWEWMMGLHMQTLDEAVAISSISGDGTTVTVVTAAVHGFTSNDVITITGTTAYNGTYTIIVVDTTSFTYSDSATGAEAVGYAGHQGHAMVLASLDVSLASSPYGRSTSVGTTTLTDTDKSWTVDYFTSGGGAGATCYLMDSAGTRFTIASNTADTITVSSGNPASGPYEIVIDTGTDITSGMISGNKILTLRDSDADLKGFAIPATSDGTGASAYGADGYWFNAADAGTAPNNIRSAFRGGAWTDNSRAGVFALYLSNPPSATSSNICFRLGKAI